jgi:hypothetical protein
MILSISWKKKKIFLKPFDLLIISRNYKVKSIPMEMIKQVLKYF